MIDPIKRQLFQLSSLCCLQQRRQWQARLTSVCAYSLLAMLLLAGPLTAAGQRKRAPKLQKVKVNSASEQAYGPFREGTEGSKSEFDPRTRLNTDEMQTAPAIASTGNESLSPVATIAQAGRSAVAASRKGQKLLTQAKGLTFSFGESFLLDEKMRSRAPTTVWENGAASNNKGGVIDPQIAVSSTAVGVLTWDKLAFYDKSGTLLPPTPTFPNPTDMQTLFAGVITEMDQHLHLNELTQNSPAFHMAQGQVGDARIVFDVFRKRWVIVGTAKNNGPGTAAFPEFLRISQRRTKIILAVSRDEDPSHGFHTYSFNGTPNDGACDSVSAPCLGTSFTPGNAGDYPSLGVSPRHYLITLHVDHAPVSGLPGHPLWGYLLTVNAADVGKGASNPRAHTFWGWALAGGGNAEGVTMPVVQHGRLSPIEWGLIASTHDDKFVITLVSPNDPPTLSSIAFDVPDMQTPTLWWQKGSFRMINYGNVGNQPITAHMVGGKLFAAFDDCRTWAKGQSQCSPSIHLLSIDVSHLPVGFAGIDRVFGWRSSDDKPDDVVGYGMPGVAVNTDGDLVVVYSRTSPQMFAQVRYSTWMHGEPDLRPSHLLRKGDGPMPANLLPCLPLGKCSLRTDTAGVAVDPFDHRSIWIAHLFANSSGDWSVAVGKVLGKQHPDLSVSGLSSPAAAIHAGSQFSVSYTIANGGDGAAVKPRVKMVLISEPGGVRTVLNEDTPADLDAGKSKFHIFNVQLPAKLGAGNYRLRAEGRLLGGETEYTVGNNNSLANNQVKVLSP